LLHTKQLESTEVQGKKEGKQETLCQHIIFKAFTSRKGKSNTSYVIQASDINTWIVNHPLLDLKDKKNNLFCYNPLTTL